MCADRTCLFHGKASRGFARLKCGELAEIGRPGEERPKFSAASPSFAFHGCMLLGEIYAKVALSAATGRAIGAPEPLGHRQKSGLFSRTCGKGRGQRRLTPELTAGTG